MKTTRSSSPLTRIATIIITTLAACAIANRSGMSAGRDGEIRITYLQTLPYGLFSDSATRELKKTGFDPDRHACILVKILASAKRKYYNSACYNTGATDDPCTPGNNIIYVVSKKDYPVFTRERYIDIRTVFLFKSAVYGQSIPRGIYSFFTDYRGN